MESLVASLTSPSEWSPLTYLFLGVFLGAVVSVSYSLRAKRPKLLITGGGGGGNQQEHKWNITITNRPSFFGIALDGESARDVHAHIRLDERNSQSYFLPWRNLNSSDHRVTIAPGQNQSLELFRWRRESPGYYLVDTNEVPVARFRDRELKFLLTLRDCLERPTEFHLTIEFDDTHLQNTPRLQIIHPITFNERIRRAKGGFKRIASAFRSR